MQNKQAASLKKTFLTKTDSFGLPPGYRLCKEFAPHFTCDYACCLSGTDFFGGVIIFHFFFNIRF